MPTKYVHKIPVTEEFIVPIGEIICVCQYLDGALRDIGRKFHSGFYDKHIRLSSGQLVGKLEKLLNTLIEDEEIDASLGKELLDLCKDSRATFTSRDSVVHSHSYTTLEGQQSRLYRNKKRQKNEYLNPEIIETFTQNAGAIALKANALLHNDRMPKD